jgi:hypothetical protein
VSIQTYKLEFAGKRQDFGFLSNRVFGKKTALFTPKMAFDRKGRHEMGTDFCQIGFSARKQPFSRRKWRLTEITM